jgi:hypothetical protein
MYLDYGILGCDAVYFDGQEEYAASIYRVRGKTPPKRWHLSTTLHGLLSDVRTSNHISANVIRILENFAGFSSLLSQQRRIENNFIN